jgi:hypothetical protein
MTALLRGSMVLLGIVMNKRAVSSLTMQLVQRASLASVVPVVSSTRGLFARIGVTNVWAATSGNWAGSA